MESGVFEQMGDMSCGVPRGSEVFEEIITLIAVREGQLRESIGLSVAACTCGHVG